jgi:hypothetical protein
MDVEVRSLQGLLDRLCLSVIEVPHALRLCSSLALHFRSIVAKRNRTLRHERHQLSAEQLSRRAQCAKELVSV